MPGFAVNSLGSGGADPRPVAHYSYTWAIASIFGTTVNDDGDDGPVIGKGALIYAKDATLPTWDIEREEVSGASLKYKFAKGIVFNDVKISWYDTQGLADIIEQWRTNIWTPEAGLSTADKYKSASEISSYAYDWSDQVTWKLTGSWPQRVSSSDLTYTETNVKLVEVVVAYDWAEME